MVFEKDPFQGFPQSMLHKEFLEVAVEVSFVIPLLLLPLPWREEGKKRLAIG